MKIIKQHNSACQLSAPRLVWKCHAVHQSIVAGEGSKAFPFENTPHLGCRMVIDDGGYWWFMIVNGGSWLLVVVIDDYWWLLMVGDGTWFLMIFDDSSWFLMTTGDAWWLWMFIDDFWWLMGFMMLWLMGFMMLHRWWWQWYQSPCLGRWNHLLHIPWWNHLSQEVPVLFFYLLIAYVYHICIYILHSCIYASCMYVFICFVITYASIYCRWMILQPHHN